MRMKQPQAKTAPLSRNRWRTVLFFFLFFLSGASGLIYEVTWMRHLVLIFGTTTFAVGTILTAFMGGLALGSYLFGEVSGWMKRPLVVYGLLEIGVGLYALLLPFLFDLLVPLYQLIWQNFHLSFYAFSLFRFFLAFLILIGPTTLMGGTLPVLSHYCGKGSEQIGWRIGLLYSLNTWGAVLGTIGSGFFLLPRFGVAATTYAGVGISLLVGLLALLVARHEGEGVTPPVSAPPSLLSRPVTWVLLVTFGLSGFAAMIYEVAWSRLLTLIVGSSTYSFTIMLSTFLIGLALGSVMTSLCVDRLSSPFVALALFQVGIGLFSYCGEFLASQLPILFLLLFRWIHTYPSLLFFGQFLIAFLVMLPSTLCMGGIFPIMARLYTSVHKGVGRSVGTIYSVNTIGTILGSFLTAFVFLPTLGIQRSITLGVGINILLALLIFMVSPGRKRIATAACALFIPLVLFFTPPWDPLLMSTGVYRDAPTYTFLYSSPREALKKFVAGSTLLFYREGMGATVSVIERPTLERWRHLTLSIDGKVDASTSGDMITQVLSGHLPLLISPHPQKVLVIGIASGVTLGAVQQHPVKEVVAVEIEPAVVEASHLFDEFNHQPLGDHRTRVIVEDARNYLLVTDEKFDVIISEPSNPWMSGPAKLFTREFFLLGREHLSPGGFFVQWIQFYGIRPSHLRALLRTFHAVFPQVMVFAGSEGDLLLIGSLEEFFLNYPQIQERMRQEKVTKDLGRIGVSSPDDLLGRVLLGPKEIAPYAGPGVYNTDDNALLEFEVPKNIYLDTYEANLDAIREASRGVAGYLVRMTESQRGEVYLRLARRYLETGEVRQAEFLAVQYLSPGSPDLDWVAGKIAQARGSEESALERWRDGLMKDPHHLVTLQTLATFYQERGMFREAAPYLERWAQVSPDLRVQYLYGVNLYHRGEVKEAIRQLARVFDVAVGPPPDGAERFLARYYRHWAYKRLGDTEKAKAEWEQFHEELDQWRIIFESRPKESGSLFFLPSARSHKEVGREEEEELDRVLTQYFVDPLNHFYSGGGLYIVGYYEDALREFLESVKILPEERRNHTLAHFYIGLTHEKLGDPVKAAEHFRVFLNHLGSHTGVGFRGEEARLRLEKVTRAM